MSIVYGPPTPYALGDVAARYDLSDLGSLVYDGSYRVQLVGDLSGNSAVNGLVLTGGTSNYASAPHSAANNITGNIEFVVQLAAASWASGVVQVLMGKNAPNTPAGESYVFYLSALGKPTITISDGVTESNPASTLAVPFANFSTGWIKANWNVAGTAKFYTSTDGINWTQLGTDVSATARSPQSKAVILEIGSRTTGAAPFTGTIYRAQLYNGINGTLAFDANFTSVAKLATSFTESSSNAATVTINTSGDLGARISGARDLVQMTQSKQPILLPEMSAYYGYLYGATGNYFSTPDSATVSITGDIEIIAYIAPDNWALVGTQSIVAKHNYDVGERSWNLDLRAGAILNLNLSQDGTTVRTGTWTTGYTGSGAKWVKVSADLNDGSNLKIYWYSSTDGATWTLETTNTLASIASLLDNNNPVFVGRTGSVATNTDPFYGKIYNVKVYNGIAGTLAADFNPQRYTSGTTFTASTGEVWTLQGTTVIVQRNCMYFDGSNDYLATAPFPYSQPEMIYDVCSILTQGSNRTFFDGLSAAEVMECFSSVVGGNAVSLTANGGTELRDAALTTNTRSIIRALFRGSNSSIAYNLRSPTNGSVGASTPSNGLVIGSRSTLAAYGNITVSEMIFRYVADSIAVQLQTVTYLARKWNIPL